MGCIGARVVNRDSVAVGTCRSCIASSIITRIIAATISCSNRLTISCMCMVPYSIRACTMVMRRHFPDSVMQYA